MTISWPPFRSANAIAEVPYGGGCKGELRTEPSSCQPFRISQREALEAAEAWLPPQTNQADRKRAGTEMAVISKFCGQRDVSPGPPLS